MNGNLKQIVWCLVLATHCSSDPMPATTSSVIVDSLNVGLAGAFIPFESERRVAVSQAIAQMPSDIVCLQEVWREEDKDLIVNAARSRFPYVARSLHDLASPVTSEIDPMCPVAPLATTAPCSETSLAAALNDGLRCLTQNCSTMPGSEMGQTTSTMCATSQCIGQVGALITSPQPDALRCYGCLASALPTENFAAIRTTCTTNPNAGLAFNGRNGVMILSKHPLTDIETIVVPGTWNRRVITRATATLPGNRRLAVYCNHLTPQFSSVAFPYTGRYGCGRADKQGWSSEQIAQARRLVSWVTTTAGTTPAVIAGDFNSSPPSGAVAAEAEETYEYLRMQLTPAVPPNYQPVCTFCGANFLSNNSPNVWIDHIFLRNIPATSVRSFERTFVEPTVMVSAPPGRVNISDHYGVRAVITL
jgi:endonuclease/exonuclease/phosphatase family metal-dependent hydrolase